MSYYDKLLYAQDLLIILFLVLSVIGLSALWVKLRQYY